MRGLLAGSSDASCGLTLDVAGGAGIGRYVVGISMLTWPANPKRTAGMPEQQRDVVEVLTHDHREVEGMFIQLESTTSPDQRADLVEQVTIELVRHSVAEEQWLYPAVRNKLPDGDGLADHEIAEHSEVEETLKALESLSPESAEYASKLTMLISDVRHHIEEEESELFPKLAAASSVEELRDLGAKIERAKETAPTRPHPGSPSRPPGNKILAPGVGLIDRLRDALTGRG